MTEPKGLRGKDKQQDALTDADGGQSKLPEGLQRDPKGAPEQRRQTLRTRQPHSPEQGRLKRQGHYYAAAALTRMQSEQQTRSEGLDKVRRHVRILVDIARWAGESSDLQHFLDQTVVQVARAVEIDHVKVLAYRRGTADLLVIAGIGWKEGVVGSATLSSDLRSAPGRCFQTGEPVVIDDMHDQQDFVISGILRRHGIVSLANTPVLIGGSAWGVLEVDSTTPRDFSQDTIEFPLPP